MKTYTKKIIFGGILLVSLTIITLMILTQTNVYEMWMAIAFILAFSSGIVFWIVQLTREKKERREEKFRRKNK